MTPFLIALTMLAQAPAAAPVAIEAPAAAEDRIPNGAPRDDYPFVAWCYGALRGYLDMKAEVMPEVTRIENQFRRPGTSLADDLQVYTDMEKAGRVQLRAFQGALTAAERASVRPINALGAQAVRQGRQTWSAGPEVSKARKAQEWMSWALPARCETVAASLEARSKLMGATLRLNPESAAPAVQDAPTAPDAPAANEIAPQR
jgi:hypothetical protein